MPVALRAGGMTEDTLALQHELSTRTGRRWFAPNQSDITETDPDRDEGPHGFARGTLAASEGKKTIVADSEDAVSVQQVRWQIDMRLCDTSPEITCWTSSFKWSPGQCATTAVSI